jgi:predicted transcriptional regulator
MAQFNPEFWEVQASADYLENVSVERALWYETESDRERRYAMKDFYQSVLPTVREVLSGALTARQREVVELYFFLGKTQEDIAVVLDLSQSTVSRHLFGTMRNGKRVGGAIPKLRKAMGQVDSGPISTALNDLQARFAQAV